MTEEQGSQDHAGREKLSTPGSQRETPNPTSGTSGGQGEREIHLGYGCATTARIALDCRSQIGKPEKQPEKRPAGSTDASRETPVLSTRSGGTPCSSDTRSSTTPATD